MKSFKQFIAEAMLKKSDRLGSNEGGVYHDDTTGESHYIKFPRNPDQAKVEVLSAKLQKLMGINTLNPKLKTVDGKLGVATKWRDDLTPIKLDDVHEMSPEQHHHIGKIFAHSVLVKNWDGVGTGVNYGQGNISKDKSGKLYGLDPGGSFHYRAQGQNKPYSADITEVKTLRDPTIAPESAHVFNTSFHLTPQALSHAKNAIQGLDPDKVKSAFETSKLDNWQDLHDTFNKRKDLLLQHLQDH